MATEDLVAGEGASRAVVGGHDILLTRVVDADLGDARHLVGLEREESTAAAAPVATEVGGGARGGVVALHVLEEGHRGSVGVHV